MLTEHYKKYIKSPQWEAKRQRYFAMFGKYCRACGQASGPIHLHHMTYERFGREAMADLIALCPPCHREVESLYRKTGRGDLRSATMAVVARKRRERLRKR